MATESLSKSNYRLICEKKNCFEAEFARAEVKEVLETGPEQLHHHHIVVALFAAPLETRNAHSALHYLVDFAFDVQLRVLGLGALELDGHLFSGGDVRAEVDVTERAGANLPTETVLVGYPNLHGRHGAAAGAPLPAHPRHEQRSTKW